MKKHELLKKAYDEYPKGSIAVFKSAPYVKHVSTGKFRIIEGTGNGTCVVSEDDNHCFYVSNGDEWAEIVKPKIAVKVENEKEFDALMKYYDSLGWKWYRGDNALDYRPKTPYPLVIDFCNRFKIYEGVVSNYKIDSDSKIIPFSDFAKEHNIKLPLLKSEDGVWLYQGDKLFEVNKKWNSDTWYLVDANNGEGFWIVGKEASKWKLSESDGYCSKAFSTQQAALDWIEAQKPKEIKVKLFGNKKAFICKDKITIDDGKYTFDLFPSDLEDINHYFKELS